MTAQPLYPDDPAERHYECWNCGTRSVSSAAGGSLRFMCACGCGWSVRFGYSAQLERSQLEFREKALAQRTRNELVDFTRPDAPGSPA